MRIGNIYNALPTLYIINKTMKNNIMRTVIAVAVGLFFTFGSFISAQAQPTPENVMNEVIGELKKSGISQEEANVLGEELRALFAAIMRDDIDTVESLALDKSNPCAQVMLALTLIGEDEEKAKTLLTVALVTCRNSRKYAACRVVIKYMLQDMDIDIDELEEELLNS